MIKDDSAKVASEEILLADHYEDGKPSDEDNDLAGLAKPVSGHLYSWQDCVVVTGCLTAFIVALLVVFVPRYAIYWGQTTQFIWVGLCLTAMAWCAQLPVRRLFLVSSINSRASTLQSLDAILRSDPTVRLADWRIRLLLALMLGLGPALSVAYKALGVGRATLFGMMRPLSSVSLVLQALRTWGLASRSSSMPRCRGTKILDFLIVSMASTCMLRMKT